jgi:large subunit ribosomal protein L4
MVECVVRNWQGEEVGQATLDLRVAKEEARLILFTERW